MDYCRQLNLIKYQNNNLLLGINLTQGEIHNRTGIRDFLRNFGVEAENYWLWVF